ncbi:MAG TPA: hypothetical protein VGK66_06765 [Solirubrobacterales bacterium]|uniref:hypothetical protein n=1 Tax=Kribbella sp. NPDC051137 TaxID=3155045 RepID=UPI002F5488B8
MSNGVSTFKPPKSKAAAGMLAIMGTITIAMFAGITSLALTSHVCVADDPPDHRCARWEALLHYQSVLRLKARLLFQPGVMVINVPWQLGSAESPDARRLEGAALDQRMQERANPLSARQERGRDRGRSESASDPWAG